MRNARAEGIMRIAVVTANMGDFDKLVPYVPQSIPYDFHIFTNANFPLRYRSMTPRLQARIPKMFAWQMVSGYDYYIWVDASFSLQHIDSVKWFVEQCSGADIAVLKHPMRNSIREEATYLRQRLQKEHQNPSMDQYVTSRYDNELIDDQLSEIVSDKEYVDDRLYASTAFVYRNIEKNRVMLKDWWYHTSRYHSVDQLSFPYVLFKNNCRVKVIPTEHHHDFKLPYLTLVRYR
jgi:hypothetical protein